ncbi:FAD-dependent oxidoreductase [Nonomuraea sp. C10]|uniref:FAD-dependent oxidoreductase n=1 Tax=Nonomuraea sp. C10 TaxID=2600577 RepID=UPI0011CDF3E4|nr:FAD-dependent oxidoreductase [Nonomuraea sp. C10]TXK41250.1 FAD-dependent oxidoreductase [Nonomuraea sp. C10]
MDEVDVVVIGAGQAGLSSAYFLRRFGHDPLVLDADDGPGGAWRHRSPTLTMDKVHGVFDLPGVRRDPARDGDDRPAASVVPAYYAAYERELGLDVRRPAKVTAVEPGPADRLLITARLGAAVTAATDAASSAAEASPSSRTGAASADGDAGPSSSTSVDADAGSSSRAGSTSSGSSRTGEVVAGWAARAVVNATGTWTRPYWPYYPGAADFRGRQLHYVSYRGPAEFAGLRVVVVGGGHSAAHVLAELAGVARETFWVTRRPPDLRGDDFGEQARREAVAQVEARVRAGLPPRSVVSVTGLGATPVVRQALEAGALRRWPMFERITPGGVVWPGGRYEEADVIVWATGFRSALDHLAPLRLREPGGGIKVDGTRAVREPRLHLVGYGPSASTIGANRAGREVARAVDRLLTRAAA